MAKFVWDQNAKKNARIAEINDELTLLDEIGYEPHPWEERGEGYGIKGDLEFEKYKLENPGWDKGPDKDGRDTPEPIYTPLTGAVGEEYAQGYYGMSDLERIRAGQAARAAAVPDWQLTAEEAAAQELNRGGLANLFRVKNQ